jgi:oligopeptide/dipeptide ABC transporter ATP-binding protein
MYLGKLVELAPTDEIFDNPLHPYTRALLSAIPVPDPDAPSHKVRLGGEVPTAANPPSGCRFHTRCGMAEAACAIDEQELVEVSPGHLVACSVVAPPVKK